MLEPMKQSSPDNQTMTSNDNQTLNGPGVFNGVNLGVNLQKNCPNVGKSNANR